MAQGKYWQALFAAIALEVIGTTVMKLSQTWTFPGAPITGLILMWLAIGLSYYLLSVSTVRIPVGVAYAFWEGFGLALVTVSSVLILQEPVTVKRFLGLLCVLSGAYLVHLGTPEAPSKGHKASGT